MAVTQADIDNLNAAIASGTRSVTLRGQTITYGTIEALIKARNDLLGQMANQDPNRVPRRKQTYAYQSGRGYDSE